MTSPQPLTASERYARSLLTAWNKRELKNLQSTLAQTSGSAANALSPAECERMELIQDLGQHLLQWDAAGRAENAADQEAALVLVRHLAGCGR